MAKDQTHKKPQHCQSAATKRARRNIYVLVLIEFVRPATMNQPNRETYLKASPFIGLCDSHEMDVRRKLLKNICEGDTQIDLACLCEQCEKTMTLLQAPSAVTNKSAQH